MTQSLVLLFVSDHTRNDGRSRTNVACAGRFRMYLVQTWPLLISFVIHTLEPNLADTSPEQNFTKLRKGPNQPSASSAWGPRLTHPLAPTKG